MSPDLNRSFALQRFERGNAVELRNGILFNLYPGLPHITSIPGSPHPEVSDVTS